MANLKRNSELTMRRLAGALAIGVAVILVALYWADRLHRLAVGASLVGTSLILEAQPAAVAAVALGFPPLSGAAISILANLAPLPFIWIGLDELLPRWPWAARKVLRARATAERYGRYGVLVFIPLAPFFGAYASIAIGHSLGFRPSSTFWATFAAMVWSVVAITYGGDWVAHLFVR
ncbi:MAG: hypothetical protein C7B45_12245 [Sulfobacillus acidophilus]|uniref:Small multi-drug export protein n=1 Tax=Sulfobacillus acidophilus TaxID=53633 RepID=A0A2T2WFR2_9FIRM|nr:MAG: hypothetical protein C7B45_12245 [Sulfobacillus acidophilus]